MKIISCGWDEVMRIEDWWLVQGVYMKMLKKQTADLCEQKVVKF